MLLLDHPSQLLDLCCQPVQRQDKFIVICRIGYRLRLGFNLTGWGPACSLGTLLAEVPLPIYVGHPTIIFPLYPLDLLAAILTRCHQSLLIVAT